MDDTLSTQEFADQVGVSRRTVQRWIQQGKIFAVQLGREFRIPFDEQPPTFYQNEDLTNSDVEPPQAVIQPESAGFPVEIIPDRFRPEPVNFGEDEEEDEEPEDCEDADAFQRSDLRKAFSTEDEAIDYASDIPVPSRVFRRCSDGFFQVAIEY